ncbi:MAG TPA: multicopper oxidase domain-containing protein [Micromonosporaceae bacterium]|nr:multicopper oxidase domain-containing protein [Micromonosporaceae bacterium]
MSHGESEETHTMRTLSRRLSQALLAGTLVVAVGMAAGVPAAAAAVSVDLCVASGTVSLPGGASAPIWGFGLGSGGSCAGATPTLPGPVIDVNEGDTVSVTVHNGLAEAVGLEIPGIAIHEGSVTAAPGGVQTYTFTAASPGTYLYQSPANAGRQLAMGLYGAMVVRSATPGRAYDSATTAYDTEAVLVLSALDPVFNADPDTADMYAYHATYWLINGKAYPDTDVIHAAGAGTRVLLRYLNAGYDNTTMALLGMHERVLARDAHLLGNPFDADAETVPAGATEDAIATIPASGNEFALFNRQLHLTNGAPGNPAYNPGGMVTFIRVP